MPNSFSSFGEAIVLKLDQVDGNMKGTQHIAGLISIAQFQLEAGMGRIASVNNDGRIQIVNGPTIRINDPNSVYSVGYDLDPFFTADD
jgi:hypothetical protein